MSRISDKGFFRIAMFISLAVLTLVVLLFTETFEKPDDIPFFVRHQPLFHAILNGTCALLLILSLRAIKAGKVSLHKKLNLGAFILSAIFLTSYVTYHYLGNQSTYGGEAPMKYVYFFVLVSHILLSSIVLPLVLLSFWFALTDKIKQHKKIVRFSYPIWLYVAVSGVLVYIFMAPYYNFG